MKKLVLILVFAVLLTFFIAFDYLLWDKEKSTQSIHDLEYSNDNKDATIDALGREIKNLEDYNNQLSNKLKLTEAENKNSEEKSTELEGNILELEDVIKQKNDLISALKMNADLTPLQNVIKDWVAKINEGKYEEAYKLMKPETDATEQPPSLSEFTNSYKNSAKSMELISAELSPDEEMSDKKGDIILLVTLNIVKPENSSKGKFTEGLNKRYFKLAYDTELKGWLISDITIAP